ncbi:hypothetical protein BJY21_003202 [Kineosphaera limosa]|uniref:hypothetical protein n=1 Tax=Kineosphaera limosa TaxID=111564 RepID=UPI00030534FB|nr:hypothetical protein [Kineosphaera limosa]NYE02018.1 hypothetical protein [Kineosphaera limosa]
MDRSTAVTGGPVEQTRDDTDADWGEGADGPDSEFDSGSGSASAGAGRDAWLRAQRPPHWE